MLSYIFSDLNELLFDKRLNAAQIFYDNIILVHAILQRICKGHTIFWRVNERLCATKIRDDKTEVVLFQHMNLIKFIRGILRRWEH